jgi:hypothetical protein
MIAIFLLGKASPVILKSVRFTQKFIEGVAEDGEVKKFRYEQVTETKTIERDSDEVMEGPRP